MGVWKRLTSAWRGEGEGEGEASRRAASGDVGDVGVTYADLERDKERKERLTTGDVFGSDDGLDDEVPPAGADDGRGP